MIQVELCRVLSAPHPTASAEGDPPVIHLLYRCTGSTPRSAPRGGPPIRGSSPLLDEQTLVNGSLEGSTRALALRLHTEQPWRLVRCPVVNLVALVDQPQRLCSPHCFPHIFRHV